MPLSTIGAAKESEESYQPILLVDLVWQLRQFGELGGAELHERLCARSIDPGETGIPTINYKGNTYSGRILNHQFAAWQVLSSNGIAMAPSVDLEVADPDLDLWNTYEGPSGPGFRGARLMITFVFADLGVTPPRFSSDEIVVFRGTINQPRSTETILRLNATSMMLMQYMTVPSIRIQKRCPWIHPETDAERADALDPSSAFFPCGAQTLDGANDDGSSCNHSLANCATLGRFKRDLGIGRFGGSVFSYSVPKEYTGRSYINPQNSTGTGYNADVTGKYGQYVPLVYGYGWVECPILTITGDLNYTRFEALFSYGNSFGLSVPFLSTAPTVNINDLTVWNSTFGAESGWVLTVNGHGLPRAIRAGFDDITRNGFWTWVNHGQRDGTCCGQAGFVANNIRQGDPYGSLGVVYVTVIAGAAESEAVPQIRILGAGPLLKKGNNSVTNGSGSFTPATLTPWVIEDLLTSWGGWTEAELDMDSFQAAADKAGQSIGFTAANGQVLDKTLGHPLWKCNLILQQPQSIYTVVQGLLNNCDGMLRLGNALELVLRETLASQQPAPIPFSNDQTGYPSLTVENELGTGYFAYVFDESNIKLDERGASTLSVEEHAFEDAPNAIGFSFNDEENLYRPDNLTIIDERDVQRVGMVIPAGFPMMGIPNFDQATRAAWRKLAQQSRGNPRYENERQIGTSGTWIVRFTTTVKALGIQPGDIIGLRSKRYNLGRDRVANKPQDFRVTEIKASADFSEFTITAWWHDDIWHLQTFGQQDEDLYSNPGAQHVMRSPMNWQPYLVHAPLTDPWTPDEWTFGIRQFYIPLTDGSVEAHLQITGYVPVNKVAPPTAMVPYFSSQPYAVTGGTVEADSMYYVAVTAREAGVSPAGESSIQDPLPYIQVPIGGAKRTLFIPKIDYHGGTGATVYAGHDPFNITAQQSSDTAQPTTFTLAAVKRNQWAPPDVAAKQLLVMSRRVWHSGIWGQPIDEKGDASFTILSAGWDPDSLAGRVVSVLGRASEQTDGQPLPVWNYRVTSNTDDTLTLGGGVDLSGVAVNDALVMRAQATSVGDNWIEDTMWANSLSEPYLIESAVDLGGSTQLTIRVQPFQDGDPIRIFGALTADELDSELNGTWTVTVIDENTIAIPVTLTTYKTRSGFAQIQGMRAGEEVGRSLLVIAGPGAGASYRITANTSTKITVEKNFDPAVSADSDNPSIFIVEDSTWASASPVDVSNSVSPGDTASRATISMDVVVPNRAGQMMRVAVAVLDAAGHKSPNPPWREDWMFGFQGNAAGIGAPGETPTIYEKATFDINNTAINIDICPHVMIKQPGLPFELDARSKYELTADFTAQVNLVRGTISTGLVTVMLPSGTTPDDLLVVLTTDVDWLDSAIGFQMDDYLTVDISASDGFADYRGAISLVIKWEIAT